MSRRISLAAGVLPEYGPVDVVHAAIAAGYSDAGLTIREDFQLSDVARINDLCATHGLGLLDVEVLWIPAGAALSPAHEQLVDIGRRLNADHVLVVSDEADAEILAPALKQISAWCADSELRPMFEFLRITQVQSLRQAKELLDACEAHEFGILIDSLHLARSGELTETLELDAAKHSYIQLCDGLSTCADDQVSLLEDALDLRSAPGEGELALRALLSALPGEVPLSLEVRSKFYRQQYPQPAERARVILQQTRDFLKEINDE